MRQTLNAVKMRIDENPARLFNMLSRIRHQYQMATYQVSEEELIASVLDKALHEYMFLLTCKIRLKAANLALANLQDAMNQLWHTLQSKTEADKKELSLNLK